MTVWLPLSALILDLVFADPKIPWHPVRAVGRLANLLEGPARRSGRPVTAGVLALFCVLAATGATVFLATRLPLGLGLVGAVYFSWSGLALGCLVREGKSALELIQKARLDAALLPDARRAVQMLVSRDASGMDPGELCRSLAESVSENFNDAFMAPFFWLCLTGPVGLWLYKAASTMDSMWGYADQRWLRLGRASARLDDLLAYVPARLATGCMFLTSRLERLSGGKDAVRGTRSLSGEEDTPRGNPPPAFSQWPGWRTVAEQARRSASPNAGWPMATAAWLFSGRCGGPTPYGEKIAHKPLMGPPDGAWTVENTAALLRHTQRAGIIGGCLLLLFPLLAGLLLG